MAGGTTKLGSGNGEGQIPTRSSDAQFEELRRLLMTPEQEKLDATDRKITELEERVGRLTVEDVSDVLPDAILRREKQDTQLAHALAPTMEETLKVSVRKDPQPIVDAIFPVIGPAIRKAISEALSSTADSFNKTLDQSLSIKSLKWRFEAAQTGRSLSEVILSHTLLYRVEQVFLIDRDTGLPIEDVAREDVDIQDSTLVSGMLTAIEDFVRDSFAGVEEEGLETLTMGDLTVLIEEGPQAMVAAVVRGVPPPNLRESLHELIEQIHLYHHEQLIAYDGSTGIEEARPLLEAGLISQYRDREKKTSIATVLVGLLALIGSGALIFMMVRNNNRWNDYLAQLDREPGIVVTDDGRERGKRFVRGLADPLARSPEEILAEAGISPDNLRSRWEPYQALSPVILERRARRLLGAPETVTVRAADDGILYAAGYATSQWITEARNRAAAFSGATGYDDLAVVSVEEMDIVEAAAEIERRSIRFLSGTSRLASGQQASIDRHVSDINSLSQRAADIGRRLVVEVHGYASRDGSAETNLAVSTRRAQVVRSALIARGIDPASIEAVGTGQPRVTALDSEEVRILNRSASVKLFLR